MDDFINAIKVFLSVFFFIFLALAFIALFALSISYASCKGFEDGTGIETKFEFGCYANVDGKWLPAEYVFGDVNELRIKGELKGSYLKAVAALSLNRLRQVASWPVVSS